MWVEFHDTLLDHRKIKKLARDLGIPRVIVRGILGTLWLQVIRHAIDGNLEGWDDNDIAEYSEWTELAGWLSDITDDKSWMEYDASKFVDALRRHGWMDSNGNGGLAVHDWEDFAGTLKSLWAKKRERDRKRAYRAKQAAEQDDKPGRTPTPATVAENPPKQKPAKPKPKPKPKGDRGEEPKPDAETKGKEAPAHELDQEDLDAAELKRLQTNIKRGARWKVKVDEVCDYYVSYHSRAIPSDGVRKKVLERLKEGWKTEDLRKAIDGCHLSPFHSGQNDDGRKHQSLELIVRNGEKVQMFIELADEHGKGRQLSGKEKKTLNAAAAWAAKRKESGNGGA